MSLYPLGGLLDVNNYYYYYYYYCAYNLKISIKNILLD
jgi:hypothetical protein